MASDSITYTLKVDASQFVAMAEKYAATLCALARYGAEMIESTGIDHGPAYRAGIVDHDGNLPHDLWEMIGQLRGRPRAPPSTTAVAGRAVYARVAAAMPASARTADARMARVIRRNVWRHTRPRIRGQSMKFPCVIKRSGIAPDPLLPVSGNVNPDGLDLAVMRGLQWPNGTVLRVVF